MATGELPGQYGPPSRISMNVLLRIERISSPPPGFVSSLQVAHVGQAAIGQQLRHTGA